MFSFTSQAHQTDKRTTKCCHLRATDFLGNNMATSTWRPLSGVRVLDLTRVLAGPFCTQTLGDLGADIIKVEERLVGDETRGWGAFKDGESAYFFAANRNKRSITVDLKKPQGCDLIKQLVAQSDVLVENFRSGGLNKLGLGFPDLSTINPRLIYASISGYGSDGPDAHRAGYDVMIQASGGLMSITGTNEGEPVKTGVALIDLATALYCHGAIMAALLAREKTGKGQKIDVSLMETQIAMLCNIGSNYLNTGQDGQRWGTGHANIVPYRLYQTLDSHIMIGALNNHQFSSLCKAIGALDLLEDPRLSTNTLRVQHRQIVDSALGSVLKRKETSHWTQILERTGLPYGPLHSVKEAFQQEQVLHRQMVQTVSHPTAGNIQMIGIPVKYSDTPADIRLPPPLLGQHTDEILRDVLGLHETDIANLRANEVI